MPKPELRVLLRLLLSWQFANSIELEILVAVAQGKRGKEIAAQLHIADRTVRAHLTNVYYKLGVDSRASAVAAALERGLLPRQRKRDEEQPSKKLFQNG